MTRKSPASPEYEQIQEALLRLGRTTSVAEGHGVLCGILCAGGRREGQAWIEELLGDSEDGSAREPLEELLAHSVAQLKSFDFRFQPLLPDDGAELAARVKALGEWVQAYLYGLGIGGLARHELSPEAAEGLRDLEEISKVSFDPDHADESDELAYAHVLEHVRMIAILIRDEMGTLRDHPPVH